MKDAREVIDPIQRLIDGLSERNEVALNAYAKHKELGDEHQLFNLSSAVKDYHKLGLLFWRKGDMYHALECFSGCAKAYNQLIADSVNFSGPDGFWTNFWQGNSRLEAIPVAAGYLSGTEFSSAYCPQGISRFGEEGFLPWFDSKRILACVGRASLDREDLDRSYARARSSRYVPACHIDLAEFHLEVLTGQWADRPASEMLDQHARLYAGLKKIRGLPDLARGEKDHNDRVVDWIFASILKRIGWSGRYLHSWPQVGQPVELGGARETLVEPSLFVELH